MNFDIDAMNARTLAQLESQSPLAKLRREMEAHAATLKPTATAEETAAWKAKWDMLNADYEQERLLGAIKLGQTGAPGGSGGGFGGNPRSFRNLFPKLSSDTGGFRDLQEFGRVLSSQLYDPRMAALNLSEFADGSGGFAVPAGFLSEIWSLSLEDAIVMPRARVISLTEGRDVSIPRWHHTNHQSGQLFGGLHAAWTAEDDVPAESTGSLDKMRLEVHTLSLYVECSNILLEDSPKFGESLGQAIGSAIGFELDERFIRGVGTGQPLGFLNDPALITITAEAGQPSSTITYGNLCSMFERMYPAGRNRAIWIASNSAIPQLLQLTLPIGTGGAAIQVMQRGPNGFELFGRPIYFTEKCPALGDAGDVSFVDLSQFVVAMRADVRLDVSRHYKFSTAQTAFLCRVRVDGRGSWTEAVTPMNGSNTLSWCVTLGAR